jgi:4-hydroxybenzoate polyprenyltransferase
MYPIPARLLAGFALFFEIYFLVIFTNRYEASDMFSIGVPEIVGSVTIFGFLLLLRIADDFKDAKADLLLFPDRPLPSGRTKKRDLIVCAAVTLAVLVCLNIIFMNNPGWFAFLMIYGILMSLWFFSRKIIQKSLPLALVTHNPVQLVMNFYVITYTCIKYDIGLISFPNFLILFALYFDGLYWEIGRKIRAPKDETDYTTYSKLFGYKKCARFVLIVVFVDFLFSGMLVYELFPAAIIGNAVFFVWFTWKCIVFIRNPERFRFGGLTEKYIYISEAYIVLVLALYLVLSLVK